MARNLKATLTLNLVVFTIVFLLHFYRLIWGVGLNFGGYLIPNWLTILFLVLLIGLIYLNYKAV